MKKLPSLKPNYLLLIVLSTLFAFSLNANTLANSTRPNTLFQSIKNAEIVNVTLKTDITKMIENKNEGVYQSATFSYIDQNLQTITRNIEVKARGKYRRRVCELPPIKLKFLQNELTDDGLSYENKLKLVTHCFEGDYIDAEQDLLKEFMTYKMLNLLTDYSYHVKLVNIKYIDTHDNKSFQRFGFILESTKELGNRIGAHAKKLYNIDTNVLDENQYNIVSMFQYMISNSDWQLQMARNIKTFPLSELEKTILIPFDFDFAGLVNPPYAVLEPSLQQSDLRDRIFLGKFKDQEALNKTMEVFQNRKHEIMKYCEEFEFLQKKNRKDVINFLESFYQILEDPQLTREIFLEVKETDIDY